ncbi:YbaY family lipoprotein [Gammaproteobacteria bacterium]|nr:YbaY family lipoprotein [Gammaproteobacteria bacterium]
MIVKKFCIGIMALMVLTSVNAGESNQVTGSVTYRERIALTPGARIEVKLLDVSLQDVAARVIAEQTIEVTHQVPISFSLVYDPAEIDARLSYAVRATIFNGDKMLFTTDRHYPVLSRGNGSEVDLVLVRVGGPKSSQARPTLTGRKWVLQSIDGEAISVAENQPAPFIQFVPQGEANIVSGNAGCNNFNGSYEIGSDKLSFGNLASTMMACPQMELEGRFHQALGKVNRFAISADRLILYSSNIEVAQFISE